MKKKSNYRTPKRLLSLFLCVLMVVGFMPYYATQNKVEAIESKTALSYSYYHWVENTSGPPSSWFGFAVYGASAANFPSSHVSSSSSFNRTDFKVYSYYDFREGANNTTFYSQFYDQKSDFGTETYYYGYHNGNKFYPDVPSSVGKKTQIIYYNGMADPNREHCTKTVHKYYNPMRTVVVYDYDEDYTPFEDYFVQITFEYYGIDTTILYDRYQFYEAELGLANATDIYTEASWQNYLNAMKTARNRYNGKATGIITQEVVNQWVDELDQAVDNLEYLSTEVPLNIYSSGEG